MRKIIVLVTLLALAAGVITAQTGHNSVQFAQVIKIDTTMTTKVTGQENPDRWIYTNSTKISKETYDIIHKAMQISADNGDLSYFQYVSEYGEYLITHKEVYGGQLAGNGMVYVTISLSLDGDKWYYGFEYRLQVKTKMGADDVYMSDLFVNKENGENEKEAIKAFLYAVYEYNLWGAKEFAEMIYNECASNDTTGFYKQ